MRQIDNQGQSAFPRTATKMGSEYISMNARSHTFMEMYSDPIFARSRTFMEMYSDPNYWFGHKLAEFGVQAVRQIVLDTETTGLSTAQGHRVIEIGCIELVNRRLTGREYHRFLNPDRDIDEGAERVHGISRADLEGQPRFPDIAEEFLDFLKDSELVIHNAEFDVGFLEHELKLMAASATRHFGSCARARHSDTGA